MTAIEIESSVRQLLRERERNLKELMSKIAAKIDALTKVKKPDKSRSTWWKELAGKFDGDPVFADIVREGRKWRNSQRPKSRNHRAHP
jgi:hypothetical protein